MSFIALLLTRVFVCRLKYFFIMLFKTASHLSDPFQEIVYYLIIRWPIMEGYFDQFLTMFVSCSVVWGCFSVMLCWFILIVCPVVFVFVDDLKLDWDFLMRHKCPWPWAPEKKARMPTSLPWSAS